jgi:hypothetical protein
MFRRSAYFEGAIEHGREDEFDAYIRDRLVPLWAQFPGALRVETLREVEAEDGSHRYPLILSITYPNRAAMERALSSDVRLESREVTKGLLAMFTGRIFHVVYGLQEHTPSR